MGNDLLDLNCNNTMTIVPSKELKLSRLIFNMLLLSLSLSMYAMASPSLNSQECIVLLTGLLPCDWGHPVLPDKFKNRAQFHSLNIVVF